MNNLEKLSSGDIATRNNGTFEQFQEVIGHCFPNNTPRAGGEMEFYEASDSPNGGWVGFLLGWFEINFLLCEAGTEAGL